MLHRGPTCARCILFPVIFVAFFVFVPSLCPCLCHQGLSSWVIDSSLFVSYFLFYFEGCFFSFDLFWFHCLLLFLSLLWDCLCCHHCHCFSLLSFVFLSYLSLMTTNLPYFPFYLYRFLRLIVHFLNCCFIFLLCIFLVFVLSAGVHLHDSQKTPLPETIHSSAYQFPFNPALFLSPALINERCRTSVRSDRALCHR